MTYVVWPGESTRPQELGGKAAALAALGAADLPIPAWFVVTPAAFAASLGEARQTALAAAWEGDDPAAVAAALADLELSAEVLAALTRAIAELCPRGETVAVRSSAAEEDGLHWSFAGQLDSFLDVPPREAAARVAEVWRSGFGERIRAYRHAKGIAAMPAAPAVLIQRMVHAEAAGVAFSADPVTGRRGVAVVSAVRGLGAALASGEADGDTFHVDRAGRILLRDSPSPTTRDGTEGRTLTDDEVRAVAELARRCADVCGRPQDIEWAVERDRVSLLQARPITTLTDLPDPDGAYTLWDNSNIAESYGGVTTPLTFSFARHVYEHVYRQLVRMMGAPESLVVEQDTTFRHMLGLIHGRVYYSLLSWYRLLALLPGFAVNRTFMEQMMGVKEGLPESIVDELSRASWRDRLNDSRRLALAVVGLATNYALLPRRIRRFELRLEEALGASVGNPLPLARLRADELVATYRDLERRLITRWDAPLLNDLFAMIFFGLLRKLTMAWCGDIAGTLQNDLLSGEGGMISAEPATRVREMASLAARDPSLVATLTEGSLATIQRDLAAHPDFRAAYDAYLNRFADRCLEELKLESPTLRDDPLPLLRAVGQLAQRGAQRAEGAQSIERERPRRLAEQRVAARLARHPLRRLVFRWVLHGARSRIRDRENLRFERTRVFGRVRQIFVELGHQFQALDLLADPRDIFYLEVEEILGFVEGTTTTTSLKELAALRQREFARFRAMEPPPGRFATRGVVALDTTVLDARPVGDTQETAAGAEGGIDADRRQGIGCCPGVVRGPVRVVRDPKTARLQAGEILVAERTDPGWIMLFPATAAVLVERGSLLSHSAIVARELGIPTIVSLAGVTRWLTDGDLVEMDGAAGTVTRIAAPSAASGQPHEVPSHA